MVAIHIGIFTWAIVFISSIVHRRFTIKISISKIIGTAYGVGVGFLIPYLDLIYSTTVEAWGAAFADIPALAVGSYLMKKDNINASTLWPHYWKYYIPFLVFGAIGGWGIGQIFDGFFELRRRRKNF